MGHLRPMVGIMKKRTRRERLSISTRKKKAVSSKLLAGDLFAKIDNSGDIDTFLANKKVFQDLLGFSSDELTKLFEQAIGLLHQHRFDEAVTAFRFLTQLNPYVCDFWIGLGAALQSQGAYAEALSQYLVAEAMDPIRLDAYGCAVDVCLEMHDITQAKAVLKLGYTYAKNHAKDASIRQLRAGLGQLKLRVQQEEPITAQPRK